MGSTSVEHPAKSGTSFRRGAVPTPGFIPLLRGAERAREEVCKIDTVDLAIRRELDLRVAYPPEIIGVESVNHDWIFV